MHVTPRSLPVTAQNPSPRPLATKFTRSRAKPGAATSSPQAPSPPPLARLASPTSHSRPLSPSKTSPNSNQAVSDVGLGQSLAGKPSGSSPPLPIKKGDRDGRCHMHCHLLYTCTAVPIQTTQVSVLAFEVMLVVIVERVEVVHMSNQS